MAKPIALVLLWAGRAIGAAFLWFVAANVAGSGVPDLTECSLAEIAMFASLCVSLIGYVLLWRWQLAGGLMAIFGASAFFAINLSASGTLPGRWEPFMLFLPGVFAVLAHGISRSKQPMR